ncbi:dihydroorotate dehydrogenase [Falsiroseomonas sp. HW251]|uniref:dihydroorotate dehydrogenase n=1 Tax=Falsiroseomonas sp. HW251 TaxID=3390998 RepID=UPI003D314AF8
MVDLTTRIGGLTLANPVMPASGTFGPELAQVFDLDALGALVTKSVTPEYRAGNPLPRLCETEAGVLNSIGIPGKGLDHFIAHAMPEWRRFRAPLVVSFSAPSVASFAAGAARLAATPGIAAIEANISCPNLEEDGRAFAMHAETAAAATAAMRRAVPGFPLWVKLSPNTGDIAAVARAVEAEGADALVVANTILGLAIDIETTRPKLGSGMGGFSGPAFKPIALRLVWQIAQAVRVPVIGAGGIATGEDAVEFMMAGAAAVQVGTATFVSPTAMLGVIEGLRDFCARKGVARVGELTGAALPSRLAKAAE